MCGFDTRFPWIAYERPMDGMLMKKKAHKARQGKARQRGEGGGGEVNTHR